MKKIIIFDVDGTLVESSHKISNENAKILNQLNTSKRNIESIETFGNLETGIVLNKPEILFNRIEVK